MSPLTPASPPATTHLSAAAKHLATVSKHWQKEQQQSTPSRPHRRAKPKPKPQPHHNPTTTAPWSPNLPHQAHKLLTQSHALRTTHAKDYNLAHEKALHAVAAARERRRVLEDMLGVLDTESGLGQRQKKGSVLSPPPPPRQRRQRLPDPVSAFVAHLEREDRANKRFLNNEGHTAHHQYHHYSREDHGDALAATAATVLTQHQRETCVLFAEKLKFRIFDLIELYNDYRDKIDSVLAEMDSLNNNTENRPSTTRSPLPPPLTTTTHRTSR
ncbi:hypothetical protein HDU86_001011 [Geranomyces michiganensis]|nr:hypothetical protein HDU86_001011 [Geranomyces michiganensis]